MLANLAYVKTIAGITGLAQDDLIEALLPAADRAIKTFLGWEVERAEYTEFYSGTGTQALVLRQIPVVAILNLWLDSNGRWGDGVDPFDSTALLVQGVDYALNRNNDSTHSESGIVVRSAFIWPNVKNAGVVGSLAGETRNAPGNIKVQYTAGYLEADVPPNYKLAVAMYVSRLRSVAGRGAMVSEETLGRWSYKLSDQLKTSNGISLPPDIAAMIAGGREWFF